MILYLDTSSLIKLYIEEPGTPEVERQFDEASLVCTSVVAYAEARSALARLCREGSLPPEEHTRTKANLEQNWTTSPSTPHRKSGGLPVTSRKRMPSVASTASTLPPSST